MYVHTHIHMNIYIYISIYVCICICVVCAASVVRMKVPRSAHACVHTFIQMSLPTTLYLSVLHYQSCPGVASTPTSRSVSPCPCATGMRAFTSQQPAFGSPTVKTLVSTSKLFSIPTVTITTMIVLVLILATPRPASGPSYRSYVISPTWASESNSKTPARLTPLRRVLEGSCDLVTTEN